MTENERLKALRSTLGLTQRLFSQSLEIKQGSYSDVERGKAGISAVLLKNLIRKYRVNPLWLCEGEGSMFIEQKNGIELNISFEGESGKVVADSYSKDTEKDGFIGQLERQQQYIENLKGIIDFLKE